MSADAGGDYDLVVIGASLGGLAALRQLLSELPARLPAAIAIVQHRRPDANSPLVDLLAAVCPMPVREPRDRERLMPGVVYLGPAGYHLLVEAGEVGWGRPLPLEGQGDGGIGVGEDLGEGVGTRALPKGEAPSGASAEGAAWAGRGACARRARGWLTLSVEGPVSWARPSIDVLFESAAAAYRRRLAAVLLTGSSEDGAAGIEAVARRGGLTIVEDPSSAFSPVSPAAALARTTVHHVLPLGEISSVLHGMVRATAGG